MQKKKKNRKYFPFLRSLPLKKLFLQIASVQKRILIISSQRVNKES